MSVWPFNRNKEQTTNLPQEVQEYYDAGQKQRTGMAWLLALATLVVTILLAMALFFGGRWIYQQLTGGDDASKEQTTQQLDNQDQTGQPPAETDDSADSSDANDQQSSSANTDQQPTTGETPTTGSAGEEIPSTGPGPGGLQ